MAIEYKQKVFCNEFIKFFDFNAACTEAKVNKNNMQAHLCDKESDVSKYIQKQMDIITISNQFITTEFVKHKLGKMVNHGKPQHKVAAAKILLGYEESADKTAEFTDLVKAIKAT